MINNKNEKLKKADFILVGGAVFLALLFFLSYILWFSEDGKWVVVYQNNAEIQKIDINNDGTYQIGNTNIIEIRGGEIKMKESNCKNQICVHHKSIRYVGETIVCLPNKIVISIEGITESENVPDAISN